MLLLAFRLQLTVHSIAMKQTLYILSFASLLIMSSFATVIVSAEVPTKELYVREIKVTGEEFVVLEAQSVISDLAAYWLAYSSSELATNLVPTQQLPSISLQIGQSILLTSDGASTCDSLWTTKLSPTLGDTRGTIEIRKLQSSGTQSTFTTVDAVNWAKPAASGTTAAVLDLRLQPTSASNPVWYQDSSLAKWFIGQLDGCVLSLFATSAEAAITQIEWVTQQEEPLAIIESISDDQVVAEEDAPVTTNRNPGLAPPQVTEILANPLGTGTDGVEEFVELYNSNDSDFDLSGFVLQTGTSTTHRYVFPSNTKIAAKSFVAFYSAQTGLTLSNTGSRAALIDPFGTQVSTSTEYTSAKDGMAWALAQGEWYWTNRPTPGSTNIIVQVAPSQLASATAKKSVLAAQTTAKKTAAKKTTTKKAKAKTTKTPAANTSSANSVASAATRPAGIHTGVLALVAIAAVGYGLYGYRHDIANKVYDFRTNRVARRKTRK